MWLIAWAFVIIFGISTVLLVRQGTKVERVRAETQEQVIRLCEQRNQQRATVVQLVDTIDPKRADQFDVEYAQVSCSP